MQGLSYIITFKIPEIESQDPSLLTKILKLILNNEHKAVLYNQSSLLVSLLESFKTNKIAPKYIRRLTKLMKEQKNFLRYKKDLFNRIKRKMPFGTPLFLIESGVFFENIHSHLPNNQIQDSVSNNLIPPEHRKKGYLVKKQLVPKFNEEEKSKENNYEDDQLNAVMMASFGQPVKKEFGKAIFGKLGRSLSVDFKHKLRNVSNRKPSQDSSKNKEGFMKTLNYEDTEKVHHEGKLQVPF